MLRGSCARRHLRIDLCLSDAAGAVASQPAMPTLLLTSRSHLCLPLYAGTLTKIPRHMHRAFYYCAYTRCGAFGTPPHTTRRRALAEPHLRAPHRLATTIPWIVQQTYASVN